MGLLSDLRSSFSHPLEDAATAAARAASADASARYGLPDLLARPTVSAPRAPVANPSPIASTPPVSQGKGPIMRWIAANTRLLAIGGGVLAVLVLVRSLRKRR